MAEPEGVAELVRDDVLDDINAVLADNALVALGHLHAIAVGVDRVHVRGYHADWRSGTATRR
ncbi:hypothetical protein ACN47A_01245 [Myxococcus fulvus]